jgi:Flp pilus assembly secretin CpaC
MRRELATGGLRLMGPTLVLAGLLVGSPARADGIVDLTIDFATVYKVDRPYKDILIGNTGIADATVKDETSFVLTGKAAGTTNLIVLDDKGDEITNSVLRVSSDTRQLTTVFKRGQRQTYSCAPVCEQVISVGDSAEAFKTATEQIVGRQQFTTGQ